MAIDRPIPPHPDHHWILPQHAILLEPESLMSAIRVFDAYQGENIKGGSPARSNLDREIGQLLTSNPRSDQGGKPDPFRDYQQSYIHLGIIYPPVATKHILHLTPLAAEMFSGQSTLAEFHVLQALGYQYPNGASKKVVISEYMRHNVLVKPILLIYQVVRTLEQHDSAQAYLLDEEIYDFIMPQRNHDQVTRIAQALINNRLSQQGQSPQRIERRYKRSITDMMAWLDYIPFFTIKSAGRNRQRRVSLEVPENERVGFEDMDRLADIEQAPETFFDFADTSSAQRLAWAMYYGSLERRTRWYKSARNLSSALHRPPQLDLRSVSANSISTQVTIRVATPQTNAQQTAELQEQRRTAHEQTLYQFAKRVENAQGTLRYDPHTVDLEVFIEQTGYFFEVKSLSMGQIDVLGQVRAAVSQLLEYHYRAKQTSPERAPTHLGIVLDRFPEGAPWLIHYLIEDREMLVCWWNEEHQRFEYPEACADALSFLTSNLVG